MFLFPRAARQVMVALGISESLMYGGKTVECMESGRLLRDILKVILR
jgi:hypothetical protein